MAAVPDQISRFLPGRSFTPLGTDGMGRSDTREALRRLFEVDAGHIVVATLAALAAEGEMKPEVVVDAISRYDIDPEAMNPYLV
jgi:pyruvate dehydrogenase E1 component